MLKNFASGDWLYVLLGLIWLGVSAYKSSQKKAAAGSATTKTEGQKKSYFDTLLQNIDDAIGDNLPQPVSDDIYDVDEIDTFDENPGVEKNTGNNYETLETDFSYDDMILQEENKNPFDATKSVFDESLLENSDNFELKQSREKREKRKIDIRKAFIYDVVLNPPSY